MSKENSIEKPKKEPFCLIDKPAGGAAWIAMLNAFVGAGVGNAGGVSVAGSNAMNPVYVGVTPDTVVGTAPSMLYSVTARATGARRRKRGRDHIGEKERWRI